jgi:hypothetical protein
MAAICALVIVKCASIDALVGPLVESAGALHHVDGE